MKLSLKRLSKLQIEVTASYPLDQDRKGMAHTVDTYLFIPKRLGINADTYPQYLFYRDLQTYAELLARPQLLSEILSPAGGLLSQLTQSICEFQPAAEDAEVQAFENHNRSFCNIASHAVDSQRQQIMDQLDQQNTPPEVTRYLDQTRQLCAGFRAMEAALSTSEPRQQLHTIFQLSDEYLSLMIEESHCRLAESLQQCDGDWREPLVTQLYTSARAELDYRIERDYASVPDPQGHNEALVYRREALHTYIKSVCSLNNRNKPEGRLGRELLLSLAAGFAMVFATAVAFLAHVKYENWTTTFFLILVISYMFKDRIKSLAQDYLKTEGQRFFFDFKNTLYGQTTSRPLGIQRQTFSFVSTKNLPEDVLRLRNRGHLKTLKNDLSGERIVLYKRKSKLYPRRLFSAFAGSDIEGISQVLQFDFTRFARKMENRKSSAFIPHNGGYRRANSRRVYHLHLVIKYQTRTTLRYQHFRIVMTRGGILRIDDLTEPAAKSGADKAYCETA